MDTLAAITVQPKVPTLRRSGDTLAYRTGGIPMPADATAETLLRRLPGIEANPDGSVYAQGTKITRVLVDGKDFFGGDAQTALRQLPAGIIERVEVIDDYGDRGRLTGIKSAESPKIINIVLKKNMRFGTTAEGAAGAGSSGKYLYHLAGNRFRQEQQASFTGEASDISLAGKAPHLESRLHYADRWQKHLSGFSSLAFNQDRQQMQQQTTEDDFSGTAQTHQQSQSQSSNSNSAVAGNGTLLYEPGRFLTLRVQPSFTVQRQRMDGTSTFNATTRDSGLLKEAAGKSVTYANTNTVAGAVSMYAGGQTKNADRWSAQANIAGNSQQQQNSNSLKDTVAEGGSAASTAIQNKVTNHSSSWNISADARYFKALGRGLFAEGGYQVSLASAANNKLTFAGDALPVNSLSSRFRSQTLLHRFRAGLAGHTGQWDFTVAADLQPGSLSGTEAGKPSLPVYRFTRLLPAIEAGYTLSKKSRLSGYYQGSPLLPTIQQLQPATDASNPQYPVTGNPRLKTGYTQAATVHYEYRSVTARQFTGFGVSAGYHTSTDEVVANLLHPRDNSAVLQQTTYENASGFHGWNTEYHFSLPAIWKARIRVSGSGRFSRDYTTTLTDSLPGHTITTAWSQSLHIAFVAPGLLESDVAGYYTRTANELKGPGLTSRLAPALTAGYQVQAKAYFLIRGAVSATASQAYTGTGALSASPAQLSASVQWLLFRNQTGTIALAGYNLLGGASNANQSASPTSVIHTLTTYTGRFFMARFSIRLQQYHR